MLVFSMKKSPVQPSPLEVMMSQLNSQSVGPGGAPMTVQIKRRCNDGSLIDANENQLSSLNTKARVATAAQGLATLPIEERTAWAIEMKDYANELYANGMFQEAMEKYVEALAASNFGIPQTIESKRVEVKKDLLSTTSPSSSSNLQEPLAKECGNIDSLVAPVLCNMAACCIQLNDFAKALKFSDTVLELRPRCGKALLRRGMALMQPPCQEYALAIESLRAALELGYETSSECDDKQTNTEDDGSPLGKSKGIEKEEEAGNKYSLVLRISESDRHRIPILLDKAQLLLDAEYKRAEKLKERLVKHFGGGAVVPEQKHNSVSSSSRSRSNNNGNSPVQIEKGGLLLEKKNDTGTATNMFTPHFTHQIRLSWNRIFGWLRFFYFFFVNFFRLKE